MDLTVLLNEHDADSTDGYTRAAEGIKHLIKEDAASSDPFYCRLYRYCIARDRTDGPYTCQARLGRLTCCSPWLGTSNTRKTVSSLAVSKHVPSGEKEAPLRKLFSVTTPILGSYHEGNSQEVGWSMRVTVRVPCTRGHSNYRSTVFENSNFLNSSRSYDSHVSMYREGSARGTSTCTTRKQPVPIEKKKHHHRSVAELRGCQAYSNQRGEVPRLWNILLHVLLVWVVFTLSIRPANASCWATINFHFRRINLQWDVYWGHRLSFVGQSCHGRLSCCR